MALTNWKVTLELRIMTLGSSCGSAGKESTCNVRDLGSIPGFGRSPGEGNDSPLQYSGLENSRGSQRVGHDWATLTLWLFRCLIKAQWHRRTRTWHLACGQPIISVPLGASNKHVDAPACMGKMFTLFCKQLFVRYYLSVSAVST